MRPSRHETWQASAHVEHILGKLGVGRRTEIATWVMTVTLPTTAARSTQHDAVAAR